MNRIFKTIFLWNSNSDIDSDSLNSETSYTDGSNSDKSNTEST